MSIASRPFDSARASAPAAAEMVPRHLLAAGLGLCGSACGLLALKLEAVLGRFDTLAYLLSDPSGKLTLARGLVGAAGAVLALLAVISLMSGRAGIALLGGCLLVVAAAAPAAAGRLASGAGLEESLLYRLRGVRDVGLIGGLFLVFLALLPTILAAPAGAWEKRIETTIRRALDRWHAIPGIRRRLLLALLALVAAAAVGRGVLSDFPNSSDENSYLTQARIFATGRMWVEAPAHPEFFRARSLILDPHTGRFFAKAFPGWAAILSLGVRAGAPGWVNPLLAALTVAVLGWVAKELLGRRGETAAVLLFLITPFFLLNSASYFNHPATLFLVLCFLAAILKCEKTGTALWAWVAGVAAAAAITIRPATAVIMTFPFFVALGARWIRRGRGGLLAGALLPVLLALAGLGTYNHVMFGSPWTTGYAAYDPGDIRPRLGPDNFLITAWWLVKLLLWTVPGWATGLYFLGKGRRLREWIREEPIQAMMAASLVLLVGTYLLFENKGGNEYGPRYYYDGMAFLTLLVTAGWIRAGDVLGRIWPGGQGTRALHLAGAFAILLTVAGTDPLLFFHYSDKVAHNRDLFTRTSAIGQSSALVFLRTGSGRMPPGDLVRNPLDFKTGIVYARDLGEAKNRELVAAYPDRPAYLYRYDPYRRESSLEPWPTEAKP